MKIDRKFGTITIEMNDEEYAHMVLAMSYAKESQLTDNTPVSKMADELATAMPELLKKKEEQQGDLDSWTNIMNER